VTPTKTYQRPLPRTWWLRKPTYFRFMMRELTSVFVSGYAIFLLVLTTRARDFASFEPFFEALHTPSSIVLHLLVLAAVLFHSITWTGLLPQVVVLWRGEERVPPRLIAAVNYLAWLVMSGIVAWLVLR
jgi:fumarate reductase subunit C